MIFDTYYVQKSFKDTHCKTREPDDNCTQLVPCHFLEKRADICEGFHLCVLTAGKDERTLDYSVANLLNYISIYPDSHKPQGRGIICSRPVNWHPGPLYSQKNSPKTSGV